MQLFKKFFETNPTKGRDPSQDTAVIMSVEGRAYNVDTYHTILLVPLHSLDPSLIPPLSVLSQITSLLLWRLF